MNETEVSTDPAEERAEDAEVLPETAGIIEDAGEQPEDGAAPEDVITEEMLFTDPAPVEDSERARLRAVIEAVVYVTDEPLSAQQIAGALNRPVDAIQAILDELVEDYNRPERGLSIREVASGYKMATKPEHHEAIRTFVRNLKPPLKLSLPALETLAVIAYKQPVTAPEIMEIRGVQGAGVLKTLLDRKLIAGAGRKNVVGKPILYKTTKDFLIQFGLRDLSELPTLKEFEELGRMAFSDEPEDSPSAAPPAPLAQADGDPGSSAPPASEPEPGPEPIGPPIHEPDPEPGPEGDPEPVPLPETDPDPAVPPMGDPPAPAEPGQSGDTADKS